MTSNLSHYIALCMMILFTLISQLLVMSASGGITLSLSIKGILKLLTNVRLLIALALMGVSPLFYIYALKEIELNVAFAIYSTIYALTAISSRIFLQEKLTFSKITGIALITIGVFIFTHT